VENLKNDERFEDDSHKFKKKERNKNRINDMGLMKIKKKIKRIKIYIKFENKIQFY
jgi:hypothetical protein